MKHLIMIFYLLCSIVGFAQVAINTDGTTPDNSAMLDVKGTLKGILIPRMSQSDREGIPAPAGGLLVYQVNNSSGFYYNAGTSGTPVWQRLGDLVLPYAGSGAYSDYLFSITNTQSSGISSKTTATSGNGIAFYGETASSIGLGVYGLATSISGTCYGVRGQSNSSSGLGVLGHAESATGSTYGVKGQSMSSNGFGVWGGAFAETGVNYGVYGYTSSTSGYGVYGLATKNTGTCYGVYGKSWSSAGYGVYGSNSSVTGITYGVYGESASSDGVGVFGKATATSGWAYGVYGASASVSGIGIYGAVTSNTGTNYAVYGQTISPSGFSGYFNGGKLYVSGNVGIGTTSPSYKLDIAGPANLNNGITSGISLRCNGDEALWYNGTYFSWGYSGTYNFFGNLLKIGGNGNVAPSYALVVEGNAGKSLGGSTWIVLSDSRMKNLSGTYRKGLKEIMEIEPVSFFYKDGNARGLPSDVEQVGFVAQDVQRVFPEAVSECRDGFLDFNMHPVNVALVNAVKELKTENDQLKARLKEIEERLIDLSGR